MKTWIINIRLTAGLQSVMAQSTETIETDSLREVKQLIEDIRDRGSYIEGEDADEIVFIPPVAISGIIAVVDKPESRVILPEGAGQIARA